MENEVERLVAKHGEPWRRLITSALRFSKEELESAGFVFLPCDNDKYIQNLIDHAAKNSDGTPKQNELSL